MFKDNHCTAKYLGKLLYGDTKEKLRDEVTIKLERGEGPCDNCEYGSPLQTSLGRKRKLQLPRLVWEADFFYSSQTSLGS